jgi:hypothetical protein
VFLVGEELVLGDANIFGFWPRKVIKETMRTSKSNITTPEIQQIVTVHIEPRFIKIIQLPTLPSGGSQLTFFFFCLHFSE